ncbi:hypothetical protein G7077_12650 [Sphingomonas piscis]|uniref:Uncharacterized protein n=1 Tax=Sphingomonas piscis TaxID=2714943 RepID=A0A6G7YSB1_9SPHN|nr:hypothetical protein [Sphingomonas piscis]QIK79627.1 hypothetical protein G7077_12650 [Sphingomonas piscis]
MTMLTRSLAGLTLILLSSVGMAQTTIQREAPFESRHPYDNPSRRGQPELFDFRQKESVFYEKALRQDWNTALTYMQTLTFATCAMRVGGGQKAVASSLKHSAGTSSEWVALNRLAKRYASCAPTIGRVDPAVLRGAVAEAMWKSNSIVPQAATSTPTGEYLAGLFEIQPRGDVRNRFENIPMSWLGRCAAFAMPDQSAALLKSNPGSPEEKSATAALIAASDRCGLKPSELPLDVATYRAAVADALYLSSLQAR